MDEDRIRLVLAKTSELKSKIISCIHKTASNVERESGERESKEPETTPDAENQENDGEEEAESLLNIKDSLDSLEAQLSSLQALQQQQWYEKQAALAEIAYCQKTLLKELKEYKGKDLEVVHEAMAFASETEEIPSTYTSRRSPLNGSATGGVKDLHNVPNNHHNPESKQRQSGAGGPFKSVKVLIGTVAKTAITVVGVITILSLAGFEPRLRKQGNQFKFLDFFHQQRNDEEGTSIQCPPGKVLVVENGETRCVVKERVEVPFESVVAIPDVSYGCG